MTFASIPFLFYFLPITLALYYALPARNAVLLAASLVFYAWGEPVYILALLLSTVVNHVIGAHLARTRSKRLLALGVALNLLALGWFKYLGWIAQSLGLAAGPGGGAPTEVFGIETHLPLGISFYTFHAISLLVDLYRRKAPAPRSWADTALYISLFPQLIAGPILRYRTIAPQLASRRHDALRFAFGARLFILGLAQKVLLANTFAVPADGAFNGDPAILTAGAAWAGLIAYALQIYFDFAGYSNMALGLGRMFGFRFPRNFDFPYASQSVTEFWRRWHITLGTWFRDYVYIPLGGNRAGPARTYVNLVAVFLLCGLWHGAAWAFVLWGAWHGLFLALERTPFGRWVGAAPPPLRHAYLLLVVLLGWVPFRTEDWGAAMGYYAALFTPGGAETITFKVMVTKDMAVLLAVGVSAAMFPVLRGTAIRLAGFAGRRAGPLVGAEPRAALGRLAGRARGAAALVLTPVTAGALLLLSAALLAGGVYNPFIYFRF